MAILAYRVLDEAARAVGTADALAVRMEPHVHKRYGNSAIYAYTNERAVPPGDVLLAAALAAGISLDDKLGIGREPSEAERQMAELRAEMAQLRGQVAELQERDRAGTHPSRLDAGGAGLGGPYGPEDGAQRDRRAGAADAGERAGDVRRAGAQPGRRRRLPG